MNRFLRYALFSISLTFAGRVCGQCQGDCALTVVISEPCREGEVTVAAETNADFVSWSLDSSTTNPISINASSSFDLTAYATGFTTNLLHNGHFDDGLNGFTSDYDLIPIGEKFKNNGYQVSHNPNLNASAFNVLSDHTGNHGNMLVIDASVDSLVPFYRQSFEAKATQQYHFEAWAANIHYNFIDVDPDTSFNSGHIGLYINGSLIESLLLPQDTSWTRLKTTWTAPNSGAHVIELVSLSTELKENDFAVDDILLYTDTLLSRTIHIDECHGLAVFSPDGDGQFDDYYIDGVGEANIYNTDGTLIRTLSLPTAWDGLNDQGLPAPSGYYVIVMAHEAARHVTLFR